ncbi:helicase-associated domain-containing protein [Paenibacillus sp. NPDC056579]|uniref:helicase-associated domain-containing protein n=1 Tax=Paenibacillus sp. NPDC056579 TaxID=3345871 RepID=UPI0036A4ABA6
MNHADYLARMPQTLRKQIEAEPVYSSWLKQGETLEQLFVNPVVMETVYNRMTARERQVLQLIVTRIGCEPFDAVRLDKLASSVMSGADAKVGFLQLQRKGICFIFRKSWGEHIYVMSPDMLAIWQQILFVEDEGSSHPAEMEKIEPTEPIGAGLAHDLFQSLVYWSQHDIKLTKSGTLHKRHLQKLSETVSLRDAWFEHTGIKYAYADVYPYSIAVLMELLTRLQLLEQQGDVVKLNGSSARQWLTLNEAEQTGALYRIWKPVVFPGAVWMQHAALRMENWAPDVWNSAEHLIHWLKKHKLISTDEDLDRCAAMLEEQWIRPLLAFGWMEKGAGGTGAVWYRWRIHPLKPIPQDEEEARFYVQPDFEILVPPDVSFAARWELASFADQHKTDALSVYSLSKESLQRGLESGRTLEEIVGFLAGYAMYELPDNVKLTLEQWAKPFGKLSLQQVILLRCESPEVAEAIRKMAGAAECLDEPLGDKAWIVKSEKLKALSTLLDKSGWMAGKLLLLDGTAQAADADKEGQTGVGKSLKLIDKDSKLHLIRDEVQEELRSADKGFIYSRHAISYFEMEQRLPNIAELYPDLNGIPAAWMKDYRTYHTSTRREMVEKAMEWKGVLQVRLDGRDRLVAPRKLQETRGTWSMVGLEPSELQEVCLLADEWQEMKIIVPGINDSNS